MGIEPKEKVFSTHPPSILHGALEVVGSNQALPTTLLWQSPFVPSSL
jgi:hypothetical protein